MRWREAAVEDSLSCVGDAVVAIARVELGAGDGARAEERVLTFEGHALWEAGDVIRRDEQGVRVLDPRRVGGVAGAALPVSEQDGEAGLGADDAEACGLSCDRAVGEACVGEDVFHAAVRRLFASGDRELQGARRARSFMEGERSADHPDDSRARVVGAEADEPPVLPDPRVGIGGPGGPGRDGVHVRVEEQGGAGAALDRDEQRVADALDVEAVLLEEAPEVVTDLGFRARGARDPHEVREECAGVVAHAVTSSASLRIKVPAPWFV